MNRSTLDEVAERYGIGSAYHDHQGELKVFSAATKVALLTAMGVDAGSWPALQRALALSPGTSSLLPPVCVVRQGEAVTLQIAAAVAGSATHLDWSVQTEAGESLVGTLPLPTAPVTGEGSRATTDLLWPLALPSLPAGYHQVMVRTSAGTQASMALIVTPPRCFESPALTAHQRLWGITLQLYTLRSESNWGIGDFADLKEVVAQVAPLGCALIGLNPLHALLPAEPAHNSPYSPSSRQFLNVFYIALPEVPEYAHCEAVQDFVAGAGAALLAQLKAVPNVDYTAVAEIKLRGLRMLYETFRTREMAHDTARARDFQAFVSAGGEALKRHATFDALHAHLRQQSPHYRGWPSWPAAFQDPRSMEVQRFAQEHAAEIGFHLYLQWAATAQLAAVQRHAREQGMALGLYGDVAVGVSPEGSDAWSNPDLYVRGVGIGAPPDPLALKGQDWGIPPQNPRALEAGAYQSFIELLRANMRSVTALRLDHVMALFRQWWVPRGFVATEGAYVHYPLDDLMGILCLESHRQQCIVIGEDLGTVPDAVRLAMERYAVAHYKVLLFEKEADGRFKPPRSYAQRALAAVTTHDLPTFRGWWQGADIELAARLDLYPDAATHARVMASRAADRRNFMSALVATGLWHWQAHEPLPECSHALIRAAHLYLALSAAGLAVVQIEDLAGMLDPVNVPGTHLQYPNWQRKVSLGARELFGREEVREMLKAMSIARTGRNPN